MKARLIKKLGIDYLAKLNDIFPFIESDDDIAELFEENSEFNGISSNEFIGWISSRTETVKKLDLSCIDIDEVSKVFPNVTSEEHLTSFFLHEHENVMIHKGYDVLNVCDVRIKLFKEYLEVE